MPLDRTMDRAAVGPSYTIWLPDGTREGTARQLLDQIRQAAGEKSEEIKKLNTTQYATRIVADAEYFIPQGILKFLKAQKYPTEFDRALRYLAEMPASGVRILTATAS